MPLWPDEGDAGPGIILELDSPFKQVSSVALVSGFYDTCVLQKVNVSFTLYKVRACSIDDHEPIVLADCAGASMVLDDSPPTPRRAPKCKPAKKRKSSVLEDDCDLQDEALAALDVAGVEALDEDADSSDGDLGAMLSEIMGREEVIDDIENEVDEKDESAMAAAIALVQKDPAQAERALLACGPGGEEMMSFAPTTALADVTAACELMKEAAKAEQSCNS